MTTLQEAEKIFHFGIAKMINVSREKMNQHYPEYAYGRVLFDYRQNPYDSVRGVNGALSVGSGFTCTFTIPLNSELYGSRSISLVLSTDEIEAILGTSEWQIFDEYCRHFDLYFGDGSRLQKAVYRDSWPARNQKIEVPPDLDVWQEQ